jgi:hypothetical protein
MNTIGKSYVELLMEFNSSVWQSIQPFTMYGQMSLPSVRQFVCISAASIFQHGRMPLIRGIYSGDRERVVNEISYLLDQIIQVSEAPFVKDIPPVIHGSRDDILAQFIFFNNLIDINLSDFLEGTLKYISLSGIKLDELTLHNYDGGMLDRFAREMFRPQDKIVLSSEFWKDSESTFLS